MNILHKKLATTAVMSLALLGSGITGSAYADQSKQGSEKAAYEDSKMKDAWLHGKLETAYTLNSHLNPFRIDTEVKDGVAYLSGDVESDIDKELAAKVAMSIEGIRDVKNSLSVKPDIDKTQVAETEDGKRTTAQAISDATTTAVVKSKLLVNQNTKGLAIDVDTHNKVVTLSGKVDSSEEKELAELVAKEVDDVLDVENNLIVSR